MKFLAVHSLFVAGTAALATPGYARIRRQESPNGPVAPGTASDCTYWETALDSSYNCQFYQDDWGISQADFLDWNPSVKADCSGIKVGNAYCVEVNNGLPRPVTTKPAATPTTSATGSPTTGPTQSANPSPTQDGLTSTCTKFYKAVSGDTCNKIVETNGNTFTFADFLKWNPAVGDGCSSLWLGYYYCVAVPGTPSGSTPTPPSDPPKSDKPSPTQDGMISTCTKFYKAVSGDTCNNIINANGEAFSLADFVRWNPAVGDSCSGLWLGYYYCVAVPGTNAPGGGSSNTPDKPTRPSPTQDGIASNCQRYHLAVSGDFCQKIVDQYRSFSLSDFYSWNPALGSSCNGLWLGYYYCIGVSGTSNNPSPPSNPGDSCNPNAPTPIQPGATCGCKRWHMVGSGNSCDSISRQYGISAGDFQRWNPNVGSTCTTLWLGYNVCVGV